MMVATALPNEPTFARRIPPPACVANLAPLSGDSIERPFGHTTKARSWALAPSPKRDAKTFLQEAINRICAGLAQGSIDPRGW
jgi:hypothetical protein